MKFCYRKFLGFLVCLIALSVVSVYASDMSADFSSAYNPNGEWSYGWTPLNVSSFTTHTAMDIDGPFTTWHTNWGGYGWVSKVGPSGYNYSGVNINANQISLTGAYNGSYLSAARWSAPFAGTYTVNARFAGRLVAGSNSKAFVIKQSFGGAVTYLNALGSTGQQITGFEGNTGSTIYTYTGNVTLAMGDSIYFAVRCMSEAADYIGVSASVNRTIDWSTTTNLPNNWSTGHLSSDMSSFITHINNYTSDYSSWYGDTAHPTNWSAYGWTSKNLTTSPIQDTNHYIEAGQTIITGPYDTQLGIDCAAVKWTAPSAGLYNINTLFTGQMKAGSNSDVFVIKKNSDASISYLNPLGDVGQPIRGYIGSAASNFTDGSGTSPSYTYTGNVVFAAGESLYFAVDDLKTTYDYIGISPTIKLVTTSDAANDWSSITNSIGKWTYGWNPLDLSSFTAQINNYNDGNLSTWYYTDWSTHGWASKAGSAGWSCSTAYLEANQVALVGGYYSNPGIYLSTIRWTPPAAGSYAISARFTGQNTGGSNSNVFIIKKGSAVTYLNSSGSSGEPIRGFIGRAVNNYADGFGTSPSYTYNSYVTLAAGDVLYFSARDLAGVMDFVGVSININPLFTATTTPQLGTTNLFANGDIENGTTSPDSWTAFLTGSGIAADWSNTVAYSGSKSLHIINNNPTSEVYWAGGSYVIVSAYQELLWSYYINMPWGNAIPYAVCFYDVNGNGTADGISYKQYFMNFTKEDCPAYPVFITNRDYLSAKLLPSGWQKATKIMPAGRPMAFSTVGAIIKLAYLDPGIAAETASEMWIDKVYIGMSTVNLKLNIYGNVSSLSQINIYDDRNILSYTINNIPTSGILTIPVRADSDYYTVVVTDTNQNTYSQVVQ